MLLVILAHKLFPRWQGRLNNNDMDIKNGVRTFLAVPLK